jgi:hypothetical protein
MRIKKTIFFALGILFLGIAYVGVVTPGIPWSTPAVIAACCFAKSSDRMHRWIMNHKRFGPFLRQWSENRVFPTTGKRLMVITMGSSLVIIGFTTHNLRLLTGTAVAMSLCAVWAWRYPGSLAEWQRRKEAGEKIGWLN